VGPFAADDACAAGPVVIAFHPLAGIFPLIEGQEFDDLVRDITQHGLREPITLLRSKILDGRNRYRACVAAKVLPESLDQLTVTQLKHFKHFSPAGAAEPSQNELLAFVLSKNLHRRQLNESQRAMVAANIATMRQGERTDKEPSANLQKVAQDQAARQVNVSTRTVADAVKVRRDASPELRSAVEQGHIAVSAAADIAELPRDRQAEIVNALPRTPDGKLTPEVRKALAPVIKEIRAEKQAEKKERRDNREAELGRKILAMPDEKCGVAIEDFEWDHEPWSRETGMDRSAANHYPTAADAHTPEEIVARTVERFKCLAHDCVLYMWTTIPHEAIAHRVLELRGFKYVSQRVWDKVRAGDGRGPGYWVTGEHEILLIAVRGKVVPPATAHFRSRFEAPVGAHSEKPDQQYEHAEYHFPSIPKIELNARRPRPGWRAWGYEAPRAGEAVPATPDISHGADEAVLDVPDFLKRGADAGLSRLPEPVTHP
jgi:N6-adenosine-specific RNA methylase IME4